MTISQPKTSLRTNGALSERGARVMRRIRRRTRLARLAA